MNIGERDEPEQPEDRHPPDAGLRPGAGPAAAERGRSFGAPGAAAARHGAASAYERHANLADKWLQKTQLNVNRTIAIAKAAGMPDVDAHFSSAHQGRLGEITEIQKIFEASVARAQAKRMLAAIGDKRRSTSASRAQCYEFLKAPTRSPSTDAEGQAAAASEPTSPR
jgi:hypothetical protein